MKKRLLFALVGAILAGSLLIPADKSLIAGVGFGLIILSLVVLYVMKKITRIHAFTAILSYFTVFIIVIFYLLPAFVISQQSGTVLDDNWWQALNWIKNNTKECAVIATYWDPGHFITGIAEHPVVFDGASQNSLLTIPYNGTKEGLEIISYDSGINQIIKYQNGSETHARIKDIGISLLTSNESLAIDILKNYKKPGCDEMYFIASSDLIGKSQWWSYFATWNPTREGQKGYMYNYIFLKLGGKRPLIFLGLIGYEYPISQQESIILCKPNNTIDRCSNDTIGLFQQGSQFAKVKKIILPTYPYVLEDPNGDLPGTIIVLDVGGQNILYLRPELENSLFTRMMLFNGDGLEKFEFVNNWGNEVKLFKVNFSDTA